jgi:hypothetical protein
VLKVQLDEDNRSWINRFEIRDREFKEESQKLRDGFEREKLVFEEGVVERTRGVSEQLDRKWEKEVQIEREKHKIEVKGLQ